jgi:rhamnosyltransferase subunit B
VVHRALGTDVEIRQGTSWRPPTNPQARQFPTHTFADVACLFGFHQIEKLTHAARDGLDLLREVSPQLIIADFAPTMRIVSAGRVPMVVAGNGYTVPPPGRPLPLMRPWAEDMPPKSRAHEGMLLAAANEVRARLSGPAVDFFADLFQGERTFFCTLAEFDPYRNARGQPPLWPFNIPQMPRPRSFAERRGSPIFCYLQNGHPALLSILAALSGIDCNSEIYVEGIAPHRIAERCSAQVHVHAAPADFARVLPEARLLLHRAGLSTAHAGLAAGVPQMVLPLQLEHIITTRALAQFKVAIPVGSRPAPDPAYLAQLMRRALADLERQEAALRSAREIELRRDNDSIMRVITDCWAFL